MTKQTIQAINTLIQAIHIGQSSGAYSLQDSFTLYQAIKHLELTLNNKEYESNDNKKEYEQFAEKLHTVAEETAFGKSI